MESWYDMLFYDLNIDGKSYRVVGVDKSDKRIEIPSTYDGLPVTVIGSCAFNGCHNIKSVIIPDTIETIEEEAFCECRGLESISIPDSVTTIGDAVFFECENLLTIEMPDNIVDMGNNVIAFTAYINDNNNWDDDSVLYLGNHLMQATEKVQEKYIVRQGTKTIAPNAFAFCKNITTVTFPDSLVSIGRDAFFKCDNMTEIKIPDSVKKVDAGILRGCHLEYLECSPETEYNKKAFDQSQIDTVGIVTKEGGLAKYLVVDNDFIYEILRK